MSLSSKGNFIVGGVEYSPKSLQVQFESLQTEDSGRTDDGVMHIGWIFRKVRKLVIEMPPTPVNDIYALINAVQGQEYNITYFDPLTNAEKTISVYTSNSNCNWYSGVLRNGLIQGFSFNAIQKAGE